MAFPIKDLSVKGSLVVGPELANEPSTPPKGHCVLWCQDNGAGKTQLMIKFEDGSAQQVAIEA